MLLLAFVALCAAILIGVCLHAWTTSEVTSECPICTGPVPEHHLGACDECARYPHRRFVCGSVSRR